MSPSRPPAYACASKLTATSSPCPREKGDTRNLTNTSAAPSAIPPGPPTASPSPTSRDASGEYQLYHPRPGRPAGPRRSSTSAPTPSFFYTPRWSPDSKHIAFSDKHLHLWYVDVDGGKPVKIDTGLRGGFGPPPEYRPGRPIRKWIAYTRDLENQLHAVFLYSSPPTNPPRSPTA